jgi:O-antigen/teichoic acid export membrane protein
LESDQTGEQLLLNRFGKHTMAALVGAVSVRAFTLVLVKILTILLPQSEYGLYALWISFVILASTFSTSAFSATIWRFLPQRNQESKESASRLIVSALTGSVSLVIGLMLVFSVMGLFGFRIVADPLYLTSLFIIGFLATIYAVREIVLVVSGSEQNYKEILAFNLLYGSSSTLVAALFAWLFVDLQLVLAGLCLGYAVPILISLLIKLRQYSIQPPQKSDFKKFFEFGGPSIIVGTVKSYIPFFASFSVGLIVGLTDVAILSIAILIAGLFSFVANPPLTAYHAYIVNMYERGNYEKGKETATFFIEIFLIISGPIAFLMILLSPQLIWLFSTQAYANATQLVPFTVIFSVIVAFSYFWKIQLDLVEKPQLTGAVYIVSAILYGFFALWLTQIIGTVGVGIAMIIQSSCVAILLFTLGNRYLPMNPRRRFWVGWFVSTVILCIAYTILFLSAMPTIISISIPLALYLVMIWATKLLDVPKVRMILRTLASRS